MAGALGVVVLIAFVMVGARGWRQDPSVVRDPGPAATVSEATEQGLRHERSGKVRQPRSATVTAPPATADPGPRDWELPERTWEPLPVLESSDEAWARLQGLPINDVAPVTLLDCPLPAPVGDAEAYRATVRAQWSCVHAAWVPVYQAMGWSTVEPAVEFYPGKGSKSECGYLEAPAFYCSAGHGTVYFGGDHMLMASRWDLSVNEMVNHEYGHHIQSVAGITGAKQQVAQTDDLERRSELQATCWSAMMTYQNRSFEFGQRHYDGWQGRLETMLVDGVHGSRESLRYWGTRGLYAETLGDCNTWLVESEFVD